MVRGFAMPSEALGSRLAPNSIPNLSAHPDPNQGAHHLLQALGARMTRRRPLHPHPHPHPNQVRDFATPTECERLRASASFARGCTGCDCKSDVDVDHDDSSHPITMLARRQSMLVRDLTGYDVWPRGAEPIRQSLYDGAGECSVHCDGECYGGPHPPECEGTRVATTIAYCEVADEGGQTSFPRGGVIVRPRLGDLVVFAYLHSANRTMDTGFSEHSGCPVRRGRKWIATTWHREGRPMHARRSVELQDINHRCSKWLDAAEAALKAEQEHRRRSATPPTSIDARGGAA